MDGSQARPWSDKAISPSQLPDPANVENGKTETAKYRLPSRPSTSSDSSDGTTISVDSSGFTKPNYQLPGTRTNSHKMTSK